MALRATQADLATRRLSMRTPVARSDRRRAIRPACAEEEAKRRRALAGGPWHGNKHAI